MRKDSYFLQLKEKGEQFSQYVFCWEGRVGVCGAMCKITCWNPCICAMH